MSKVLKEKLRRYKVVHPRSGEELIILEVIRGKPFSREGGVWIQIPFDALAKHIAEVKALRSRDERIKEYKKRGLWKYIDKWLKEGIISESDVL